MLVLTPAAYHRQAEPRQVSERVAKVASVFLILGLVPMMAGIVMDVYVISYLVTGGVSTGRVLSPALLAGYVLLWFAFPAIFRRSRG
jgi:hypothetical protein